LKPKLPKSKILKSKNSEQRNQNEVVSPVLVSTDNEEYIYYLTPTTSFVFHYSNVASDMYLVRNAENNLNLKDHQLSFIKQYKKMDLSFYVQVLLGYWYIALMKTISN